MPAPSSFVASPGSRVVAFAFDALVVLTVLVLFSVPAAKMDAVLASPAAIAAFAWVYTVLALAFNHGRTFGKTVQHIAVLSSDGQRLELWRSMARATVRFAPLALLEGLWQGQPLRDGLPMLLANVLGAALWLAELTLLFAAPARRTLADRFADSLVVNLPPPQPHRAPAAPMFSADDREFGVPPRLGHDGA